ncbi:MAG: peroxidase family protein, partial [Solirubrobacterales bacterium]
MDVMGTIEGAFSRVNSTVFRQVNRAREWWQLPTPVGLLNLRAYRDDLRQLNLFDTEEQDGGTAVALEDLPKHRTYDGSAQDPTNPRMGQVGTRFGRNVDPTATPPETMPQMMEPNPREVSLRLLRRDTFKPATSLNVLAACWIQFENHDWFGHGENNPDEHIDVPLPSGDDEWPDGDPMKIRRTHPDRTRMDGNGAAAAPTYVNTVTHWWDGSQIYGSSEERNRKLRSGEDGKMATEDGRLPNETERKLNGVDLTGFSDNYWIGLSLLHTLFVREHNAICDHLKGSYPSWDDERLFLTARLVNSALMAKIHTVEWTPGILANPVLERAMHANWYGVLPMWVRQKFGHVGTEMIGGVVGSNQAHHAAPYAITEEFVSVYRLHPLLPDDYEIRDHRNGELIATSDFDPVQGAGTRKSIDEWGMSNLLYSFGTANPGAITLRNHPRALSNHVRLTGERVDLGTIDILRDRERGVSRYNDFREKLRKRRIKSFDQLTDNPEWAREIEDVYDGDIDRVDLQVGLLAEPLPPGFGFSDTAFRI